MTNHHVIFLFLKFFILPKIIYFKTKCKSISNIKKTYKINIPTEEERSPLVLQGLDIASLLLLLLLPPIPQSRVALQPHQSSLPLCRRRTRSDGDGPDRVI